MHTFWQAEVLKRSRLRFCSEWSQEIKSALIPPQQTKPKASSAPVQGTLVPFKQRVITQTIQDTPPGAMARGAEPPPALLATAPPASKPLLSGEETGLNAQFDAWFAGQPEYPNHQHQRVLLSALMHESDRSVTDMISQLLDQFRFTEVQCKGLGHLFMRTGPEGVLMCLQTLQRMKKRPLMFDGFNEIFLDRGDFSLFMDKENQENLVYFTQLRGATLTWWNELVTQERRNADDPLDFNDLLAGYRSFVMALENMGLHSLPRSSPFKQTGSTKAVLQRALDIIQRVHPANRPVQLIALDGLDFEETGAWHAMEKNGFQWVSREMNCSPESGQSVEELSYEVSTALYYQRVRSSTDHSPAKNDQFFYRYLAKNQPVSILEIYNPLKNKIVSAVLGFTPQAQAQLLYLLATATQSDETELEVTDFLTALQGKSELIDLIFLSFSGHESTATTPFKMLTQLIRTLDALTYPASASRLTTIPKLLVLLHRDPRLLTIVLTKHTTLQGTDNESTRFLMSIDCLTEQPDSDPRFLRVLALLSDELSYEIVRTLLDSLADLDEQILSMLSEINVDKSQDLRRFNVSFLNRILGELRGAISREGLEGILHRELPGIIIGDTRDKASTFTIGDCMKDYLAVTDPIAKMKSFNNSIFNRIVDKSIAPKVTVLLTKSGQELYNQLDDMDQFCRQTIEQLVFGLKEKALASLRKKMTTDEEVELLEEYQRTLSLKTYIPYFFLGRFENALTQSVRSLQTGKPALDQFLMTALQRVTIPETDSFGSAMKHYDTAFESAKSLTNALLAIKQKNGVDYNACVELLGTPNVWQGLGLQNMALLLEGLSDPVSTKLSGVLSSLESIRHTTPTDAQLRRAIVDVEALAHEKDALGAPVYADLLRKTIQHDLTQQTPFPLAALIEFKKSGLALDAQKADALFQSVLRIINICPSDNQDALIGLIEKTMELIKNHSVDRPNIVPCLAIELARIATDAEKSQVPQDVSLSSPGKVNGWFLLNMFSTIISAIQLLWMMVAALWTTPTPEAEAPITANTTLDALRQYTHLLDIIDTGINQGKADKVKLFTFWPYPSVQKLSDCLEHPEQMSLFDRDPWGCRQNKDARSEQSSTDRVDNVIEEITHLTQEKPFTTEEKDQLKHDFDYLNTIGNSSEMPLHVGGLHCDNLTLASRDDLRALLLNLRKALHATGLNRTDDKRLTLELLAVMREAYYRSTGLYPYSTQMLSVLVSLQNPGNLMLQINTGEGKSTTTAILAGLQCVLGGAFGEREGKARIQLVLTANQTLVEQSYNESHHFFNDFLQLSSSVMNQVEAKKVSTTLEQGGIIYTTVQDLSFYKQQENRQGRSFTEDPKGRARRMDCIIDECDSTFLDGNYMVFRLVAPLDQSESTLDNPDAWIYPLVVQFVAEPGDTELLEYIEGQDLTTSQRARLLSIDPAKLVKWEVAAKEVMHYQEGVDFVILEEERRTIKGVELSMAVVTPLSRASGPQRGSTFPGYRQEMLQARMQRQMLDKYFPIDPEVNMLDQESVKSLIDVLVERGRILGVSGTVGSDAELVELKSTLGMGAVSIPPHKKNRREISKPRVHNRPENQDNALKLIIEQGKGQPLLVFCETILEVNSLHDKLLKKYPRRAQKITKKESEFEIAQSKNRAGERFKITICTPEMGRGVDFKTDYPNGFHLHQRFIGSKRDTSQVMGRVARNGQKGTYSASFVIKDVPFQYGFSFFGLNETAAMTMLKEQQEKITQDAAKVRYYIDAFDEIKQGTLQQFDAYKKQLLAEDSSKRRLLDRNRTALIEAIGVAWKSTLPEGPNPYLDGTREELKDALKRFESVLIPELWATTSLQLEPIGLGSVADIRQILAARKVAEIRKRSHPVMSEEDLCLDPDVKRGFLELVDEISRVYSVSPLWKNIAEKIKAILASDESGVFYELEDYLRTEKTVKLTPRSQWFFSQTSKNPVGDLLKLLEAKRPRNYLVIKAMQVQLLFDSIGIGSEDLTITAKHSALGESFELCMTVSYKTDFFAQDRDVVQCTSNIELLQSDLSKLRKSKIEQKAIIEDHKGLIAQVFEFSIEETTCITCTMSAYDADIQSIHQMRPKKTYWSTITSIFSDDEVFITDENRELIEALLKRLNKELSDASETHTDIGRQIAELEARIEKEDSDVMIITKTFESIDELLTYQDKLRTTRGSSDLDGQLSLRL